MEKQLKGKGFLRITGILMIIAGAVEIIVCGIIALIMAIIAIIAINTGGEGVTLGVMLIIGAIIALVGGIVELIAGIVGTRNAARPERYKRCIVWGIIVLVLNIVSLVFSLFSGETQRWMIIITLIFGIIIPILFIIGALINRSASLKGATSVEWAKERLAEAERKYEVQKVKDAERAERQEAKRVRQEERAEAKAAREEAKAAKAEAKAAEEAAKQAEAAQQYAAAQTPVNDIPQSPASSYTEPSITVAPAAMPEAAESVIGSAATPVLEMPTAADATQILDAAPVMDAAAAAPEAAAEAVAEAVADVSPDQIYNKFNE